MSVAHLQHDLLLQPEQSDTRRLSSYQSCDGPRVILSLDHRAWLELLSDEWWPSNILEEGIRCGINSTISHQVDASKIAVNAIINPLHLPNIRVPIYRAGTWTNAPVRSVRSQDQEIAWPGPFPLSAVESFSVSSDDERARLIAMVKGFANVEMPPQSIQVCEIRSCISTACAPQPTEFLRPPEKWNRIRGAAAMAAWAVPAIDPFLNSICWSLSTGRQTSSGAETKFPWLQTPPWQPTTARTASTPLWAAAVEIFSEVHVRSAWRPVEVLLAIVARAEELGASKAAMTSFADATRAILEDREVIGRCGCLDDALEVALQLVLLRPTPDRFVSWIDDLPSMPPVAWWTGAILSGFLNGFRDLDLRFRGTAACRQLLSIRTWRLFNSANVEARYWPDSFADTPHWRLRHEKIQLMADEVVWAERAGSSRGRWYRANFRDEFVYEKALKLAQDSSPKSIKRILHTSDSRVPFSGKGILSIDAETKELVATGQVILSFDAVVQIEELLDLEAFRNWLVNGSISQRLPEPPSVLKATTDVDLNRPGNAKTTAASNTAPPGLYIALDFISPEEEKKLLAVVDDNIWLNDLSRRVQHYGWRYNYKSRKLSSDSYLGPLPEWANELGVRLLERGLVGELPDQVIVNEYIRDQGIARHVDSPTSFRGAVATISLCESWGMIFRSPKGVKVEQVLERRSVAILDGPARHTWTHELPKRRSELAGPRQRRISLTFRKVEMEDPSRRAH